MITIRTANFVKLSADFKTSPNISPGGTGSQLDMLQQTFDERETKDNTKKKRRKKKIPKSTVYQLGIELPDVERSDKSKML